MYHKMEIYCWSDEDYEYLLEKLNYILNEEEDYELKEEEEYSHIKVFHHHFDFRKKEK